MLAFLGLPYETIDLDMANGAHKAPRVFEDQPNFVAMATPPIPELA
jgi:glutathione S-transferase